MRTSVNEFFESIPKVYQNINGKIIDVKTRYILSSLSTPGERVESLSGRDGLVTFELGSYNPEQPLIIDPWVSYYGGIGDETGISVTADPAGDAIFTGKTASFDFPISPGAWQTAYIGADIFVVKMGVNGNRIWATYYGGTGDDRGYGITSDINGDILVAGFCGSGNFPIGFTGANVVHQGIVGGTMNSNGFGYADAVLIKLNPAGSRLWATYYGGLGDDRANDVVTDGNNIYLYGHTTSTNGISTPGSFQPVFAGGFAYSYNVSGGDLFVAKFASNGSRIWGTYVGGSDYEFSGGIACDASSASVYITGTTASTNFPVTTFQTVFGGGTTDGFLFKFSSSGTQLWSTYYGGPAVDYGNEVETDGSGNVIFGGSTFSATGIASAGADQVGFLGGTIDVFIAKFGSNGARQWCTYLGGNQSENLLGIDVDRNDNIYLCGEFEDSGPGSYNVSPCAYQSIFGGGAEDQFVAKYNPGGQRLCVTFMGGTGEDDLDDIGGGAIAISGNSLYITGGTHGPGIYAGSGNYPVTSGAFQTIFGGGMTDAFIDKLCINLCEPKVSNLNFTAITTSVCINKPVLFTPTVDSSCDTTGYKLQWTFTGGSPLNSTAVNPTVTYPGAGSFPVKLVLTTACKKDSVIKTGYITVNSCGCVMSAATAVTSNISCSSAGNGSANVTISNGVGGSYTYSWSNGNTGTTTVTTIPVAGLLPGTYTVTITNSSCTAISSVTLIQPLSINSIAHTNITCNGGNNGSATVTINSGTGGPYTYSWSASGGSAITNSTTQQFNNLSSGTYTVTITEGSCASVSTVILTQPLPISIGYSVHRSCATNLTTATASPANGTSPYIYLWSNTQTTATASGLNSGTYSVTTTDAVGCISTGTVVVQNRPLVLTTASSNVTCNSSGKAAVIVTSGDPLYTYSWNNGQTVSSVSGLSPGGYTVTVTDVIGCTATQTLNITSTSPVSAAFTQSPGGTICRNTVVAFTHTGTSGTYSWIISSPASVSGTTADFSYNFIYNGSFSVTHIVTNAGCTDTVISVIKVIPCTGPTVIATGSSICSGSCATITSSLTGGAGPYTYNWSTGAITQNIIDCPAATTIYTVSVTDSGGNTATATTTIVVSPPLIGQFSKGTASCAGCGCKEWIMVNAAGGTPPYSYSWPDGYSNRYKNKLCPGTYLVNIKDKNGCSINVNLTVP